jgi:hypothetical protein
MFKTFAWANRRLTGYLACGRSHDQGGLGEQVKLSVFKRRNTEIGFKWFTGFTPAQSTTW